MQETWCSRVLQAVCNDRPLCRIALAVGALSRSRYTGIGAQQPPDRYALVQFNLAIRELSLLDHSQDNVLRVVLASITVIVLEFLLENYSRIRIHLRSAIKILSTLERRLDSDTTFYLQALAYIEEMLPNPYRANLALSHAATVPD